MMNAWVMTKVRKIGTSGTTDSFTPRMFMTVSTRTPAIEKGKFVRQPGLGQEAEQGVRPARHGYGDREHVVDQERRTGDHPRRRREQFARDEIAAPARGKELDDLRVAGGDDHDRDTGHDRDEDREIGMALECEKGLLRTIAGGRQTVGAKPDPGKERDERELVKK